MHGQNHIKKTTIYVYSFYLDKMFLSNWPSLSDDGQLTETCCQDKINKRTLLFFVEDIPLCLLNLKKTKIFSGFSQTQQKTDKPIVVFEIRNYFIAFLIYCWVWLKLGIILFSSVIFWTTHFKLLISHVSTQHFQMPLLYELPSKRTRFTATQTTPNLNLCASTFSDFRKQKAQNFSSKQYKYKTVGQKISVNDV